MKNKFALLAFAFFATSLAFADKFCVGPGACGPQPKTYRWIRPTAFMNGPIDSFVEYDQPEAACNTSTKGKMMVVDTGKQKLTVICSESGENLAVLVDKIKAAKVEALPIEIGSEKGVYGWQTNDPPQPGGYFCYGGASCYTKSDFEAKHTYGGPAPCPVYKCARLDTGKPAASTCKTGEFSNGTDIIEYKCGKCDGDTTGQVKQPDGCTHKKLRSIAKPGDAPSEGDFKNAAGKNVHWTCGKPLEGGTAQANGCFHKETP